jgi:hypothetical protein
MSWVATVIMLDTEVPRDRGAQTVGVPRCGVARADEPTALVAEVAGALDLAREWLKG